MDDALYFDPQRYKHWITDAVRFSDLDPLGHVNNNAIGEYFENARASFFGQVTPAWPRGAQFFVLGRNAIDFRRELHRPARLKIGSGLLKLGRTSITTANALFRVEDQGETGIAYCESISVWIDHATRQPVPLPDALRQTLTEYLL